LQSKAQQKTANFLTDTTFVCYGDSLLISFTEEQLSKNATIQWETPYGSIYNSKFYYIKFKGQYNLKIRDGKKTYNETTFVKTFEKPKINIRDTFLCTGSILQIITKNKSLKYQWSTGETTDNINIEKPNKYWVKASNKACSYIDTFKVVGLVGTSPNFGKELVVCENEPNKALSVKAPNDVKLYWNTGANSAYINATKEGVYWVKSISKNCGTKTDSVTVKYKNCDCEIYIPNSFTPNDDDRNDLFAATFQCEYSYYSLIISDRWGNVIFNSNNINSKWDGKFKSNPCPDDVYVYHLEVIQKSNEKKVIRNGKISLFR
jgi:gliding motility-associated-like protein